MVLKDECRRVHDRMHVASAYLGFQFRGGLAVVACRLLNETVRRTRMDDRLRFVKVQLTLALM
jgi:hypothetical protein